MHDPLTRDNFVLIVVSIILAALIVRVVYSVAETIGVFAEEVYDEKYRDSYTRTTNLVVTTIVITGICIFLYIVVYNIWLRYEIGG